MFVIVTLGETCSRELLPFRIRYQNCIASNRGGTTILSFCSGNCISSSRPSIEYPGQMEHFCECCSVNEFEFRVVRLICFGEGRPYRRAIHIKVPTSCQCKPCALTHEHGVATRQEIWTQGKRSFYDYERKEKYYRQRIRSKPN